MYNRGCFLLKQGGAFHWYINEKTECRVTLYFCGLFLQLIKKKNLQEEKKRRMWSLAILLPMGDPFLWKLCKSLFDHLTAFWFSLCSWSPLQTLERLSLNGEALLSRAVIVSIFVTEAHLRKLLIFHMSLVSALDIVPTSSASRLSYCA